MIDLAQARLTTLAVHKVGNKIKNEGYVASESLYELEENMTEVLQEYFLTAFKAEEYFKLSDESGDLSLNEVFKACHAMFTGTREDILPQSVEILKHLYSCAMHPHIKGGEVYVAHFRECIVDEVTLEAIGIFKTENKDLFLDASENEEAHNMELVLRRGIPLKKLDKGCLIFNTFPEDGYSVMMVDRNSEDTAYWRDDFLQVTRIQDHSFQTQHFLNLTKDFCDEVLSPERDKKEQLVFLNRSINYFNKNKEFDVEGFKANVVEPQHRQKFDEYRVDYENDMGLPPADEGFQISKFAVRQMKKDFKSVMTLDTQIEIRMLTKDAAEAGQYIERGFDETRNMYYYQVFFNAEEG
ncbi:MAG: nucleoid-associated protein [Bacteroidia bacterium]|nr:nucleoid-associated protein [Bacteroidia bacterium]